MRGGPRVMMREIEGGGSCLVFFRLLQGIFGQGHSVLVMRWKTRVFVKLRVQIRLTQKHLFRQATKQKGVTDKTRLSKHGSPQTYIGQTRLSKHTETIHLYHPIGLICIIKNVPNRDRPFGSTCLRSSNSSCLDCVECAIMGGSA
jgi:hypothetical protein